MDNVNFWTRLKRRNMNNNKEENFSLSDMDDDVLQNLIKKDVDNTSGGYKL